MVAENDNHLSILSEGHGVMRATGHLFHLLVLEISGYQHWGQHLVGSPIPQLAIAIVPPRKQLSICNESTQT